MNEQLFLGGTPVGIGADSDPAINEAVANIMTASGDAGRNAAADYNTAAIIWTVIGVAVVGAFVYDATKKKRRR